MDYEVVELEQKQVVGLKIRTSNTDENMGRDIGKTWTDFYSKGIYAAIANKVNGNTIGLYTNYEKDFTGEYDMLVCCEVSADALLPEGVVTEVIPTGKYAKFIVKGDVQKAVYEFWNELWHMNLNRAYTSDFEEYQATSEDTRNAEIHIYISLRD
jgi:predicted transcriptional regulator YdeE